MKPPKILRPVVAATVVMVMTLLSVAPAHADTSKSIAASQCTAALAWSGANYTTPHPGTFWPYGTVKHCATKYKLSDVDPKYDYYMVEIESKYSSTKAHPHAAKGSQSVYSSHSPIGNVYSSTAGYTSKVDCKYAFTISAGIGPLSFSVSPNLCKNYSVSRYNVYATGVAYSTGKVQFSPKLTGAYVQKVAQGAKPTFNAAFTRPTYTHTTKGSGSNTMIYTVEKYTTVNLKV